ncbi:MAG: two-component system, OmpR family, phosphate regulon response regulator PhoB [Solirubrobacteraceae bacterium]|nr:two-component system, OmpR family, phosphate regulon response regulator PhoB [Solirubrobacteraceae bacterium]
MQTKAPLILIVEDHPVTRQFLADNLAADGFEPLEADSTLDAMRLLRREAPDLALIDLGLPDRDGLDLLHDIRVADCGTTRIDAHVPVILLTGRAGELDRIRGFERGADDYVVKPFSYPELRARVAAVLARSRRRPGTSRLRVGPLEVDVFTREVMLDGRPIHLSKKEFALLRTLAEDPYRVFTRDELLRGVWGYQARGTTRTLDSHASRLRRKLSPAGRGFVVNVWGIGYRLLDSGMQP